MKITQNRPTKPFRGTLTSGKTVAALSAAILLTVLDSCDVAAPESAPEIDFDTKVVEVSQIVNLGARNFKLEETKVYNSTGKLGGVFRQVYDSGGLVSDINAFSIAENGTELLTEHQVLTYAPSTSNVTLNESFDVDGVRKSYFQLSYHAGAGLQNRYLTYEFFARKDDGSFEKQSERRATYYWTDGPPNGGDTLASVPAAWNGKLRTEQYFSLDSASSTMKLTKENAYWYDANGQLLSEILHVVRGSDQAANAVLPAGVDERYFYFSYSRNPQNYIFSRIQFLYADAAIPGGAVGDHSFTVNAALDNPFSYNINFDSVKYQVGMEIFTYTGEGDIERETIYSYGLLQEIREYAYVERGLESERARYVDGGSVLDERRVTRYAIRNIDGEDHWVKETYTYTPDDNVQLDKSLQGDRNAPY